MQVGYGPKPELRHSLTLFQNEFYFVIPNFETKQNVFIGLRGFDETDVLKN